jgi:glutamate-1-semialdehyde aminotransferase
VAPAPSQFEAAFLSTAHGDGVVDAVLRTAEASLPAAR